METVVMLLWARGEVRCRGPGRCRGLYLTGLGKRRPQMLYSHYCCPGALEACSDVPCKHVLARLLFSCRVRTRIKLSRVQNHGACARSVG